MEIAVKLPPNGKPYNLLTVDEVESFDYYRKNGGKLGIHVALKVMETDHVGAQLVVIVKSIKEQVVADYENIKTALLDLNSSRSDKTYQERLNNANPKKLGDLYGVKPIDIDQRMEVVNVLHQYRLQQKPTQSEDIISTVGIGSGQYIPAPKTFLDRVKILFGLY